ncbi:hypothetical protein D3C78_1635820 [compost metagenome]
MGVVLVLDLEFLELGLQLLHGLHALILLHREREDQSADHDGQGDDGEPVAVGDPVEEFQDGDHHPVNEPIDWIHE